MNQEKIIPLTDRPVPELFFEQLQKFSKESIGVNRVSSFDLSNALQALQNSNGIKLIGIDLGGDKAVTKLFIVKDNKLVLDEEFSDYVTGDRSIGYLESFEKTAMFATANNIPVGISYGASIDGTKPVGNHKFPELVDGLVQKYDGDFASLFPTLGAILNDGPAGLISGALQAFRQFEATEVIHIINGSGMNASVLKNGEVFGLEAGHVEAVQELNTYNQDNICSKGHSLCLERLGANKFGIEMQWEKITGNKLSARKIEDAYKAGDQLAGELYDHSALVLAHMIQGVSNVFEIDLSTSTSAVVGHGGAFKFPGYGDRLQQILIPDDNQKPQLILAKDYTENSCLEGAAIATLTKS